MKRLFALLAVLLLCLSVASAPAWASHDDESTPVGITGGGYVPYDPPIPRLVGNNILVVAEMMHRVLNLVDAVKDFADKMGAPYLLNPIIAPSW